MEDFAKTGDPLAMVAEMQEAAKAPGDEATKAVASAPKAPRDDDSDDELIQMSIAEGLASEGTSSATAAPPATAKAPAPAPAADATTPDVQVVKLVRDHVGVSFGVIIDEVDPDGTVKKDMTVRISQAVPGSPAALAASQGQMKVGDVLVSLNGTTIANGVNLRDLMPAHALDMTLGIRSEGATAAAPAPAPPAPRPVAEPHTENMMMLSTPEGGRNRIRELLGTSHGDMALLLSSPAMAQRPLRCSVTTIKARRLSSLGSQEVKYDFNILLGPGTEAYCFFAKKEKSAKGTSVYTIALPSKPDNPIGRLKAENGHSEYTLVACEQDPSTPTRGKSRRASSRKGSATGAMVEP